jgi:hypothetical protein
MPKIDELDRYNIGSALRQKLYLGGLSMCITFTVAFVWLYITCQNSKEEIWKLYISDVRQSVRQEINKADNELSPKLNEVNKVADSLRLQIEKLKNTKHDQN